MHRKFLRSDARRTDFNYVVIARYVKALGILPNSTLLGRRPRVPQFVIQKIVHGHLDPYPAVRFRVSPRRRLPGSFRRQLICFFRNERKNVVVFKLDRVVT